MSKSKGNVVNPWQVIEQHGADAVRLFLVGQSQVWLTKRFDAAEVGKLAGGFLNTLRNTYNFFQLFAEEWRPGGAVQPVAARPLVDRWVLARLDQTVAQVRAAWNDYDVTTGTRAVMDFVVDDLSTWYVRLNRPRFWAPDRAADEAALATLHECLATVAKLLAPAAPFLSDWLHRALAGTSVHLQRFPLDQGRREPDLVTAMSAVRRLASLARAARETRGLKGRQPLARMQLAIPAAVRGPVLADLLDILVAEVNVKTFQVVESDDELVTLRAKANFRSLGKRYGKATPQAAEAVATLPAAALHGLERGESVRSGEWEFFPEDVTVTRDVASDWVVQAEGPYVVALDPVLTPDLIEEGLAREVVNRVQRLRKDADFEYTTRIDLSVSGAPDIVRAVEAFQDYVMGETLARRLQLGNLLEDADITREVDIEGRAATLGLRRHDGRKG